MKKILKKTLLFQFVLLISIMFVTPVMAASNDSIQVEIISPKEINSIPIHEDNVEIKITNNGKEAVKDLTCFLTVIDKDRKQSFPMDEFGVDSYQTRDIKEIKPGESTFVTIPIRIMYVGNFRIVANVLDYTNNQTYAAKALVTIMTSTSKLNKNLVIGVSSVVPSGLFLITTILMKKRGSKKNKKS